MFSNKCLRLKMLLLSSRQTVYIPLNFVYYVMAELRKAVYCVNFCVSVFRVGTH